jgi:hypothetical protein
MISLAQRRKYYQENKERINQIRKEWRAANKDKVRQRRKVWNEANQESKKLSDKIYYESNKDKVKNRVKTYRENNKEKRNLVERERRKVDLEYHIKSILRGRLRLALEGNLKSQPTMALLGCDISTFIRHIENQFTEGMSWNNYGCEGWHIDHIKPCAAFDLSKPEEQATCFHYTNLQPLWAKDNLIKGSK